MKKALLTVATILGLASAAYATTPYHQTEGHDHQAGDQYHVYRRSGRCEIDTRSHDKWKSGRGSGWTCLGHFNYRTDAMKLFDKSGCKR